MKPYIGQTEQTSLPDIRLVMIVKNEGHVIERCLRSVLPFISSWAITDTGSMDDTAEKIAKTLKGIPGKLFYDEWFDFGTNRNMSLAHARSLGPCHYLMFIDADEVLTWESPKLPCSGLELATVKYNGSTFCRPFLASDAVTWGYIGRVHERLVPEIKCSVGTATITSIGDGGRHVDPECQMKDIGLALNDYAETAHPYTAFCLATMHESIGDLASAERFYQDALAKMGSGTEYAWYSAWRIAEIHKNQADGFSQAVVDDFIKTMEMRNTRVEPAYSLAGYFRKHGFSKIADQIISKASEIVRTNDTLFVDVSCYKAMSAVY